MLLVSDYDGTIKKYYNNPNIFEKYDFKKEIKAINKYVNDGNEFAISTFRKTPSIRREIEEYKILYNYLMTYNGLVTLDNKDRIINVTYLDKETVKELISIAKKNDFYDKMTFYNEFGSIDSTDNIVMIGIRCVIPFSIINVINGLNIYYDYNRDTLWLHERTDKVDAIRELSNYLKLNEHDIYTIGDSPHDSEMVKNYNGHCIINSELDKLLYIDIPREKNVRSLIKKFK